MPDIEDNLNRYLGTTVQCLYLLVTLVTQFQQFVFTKLMVPTEGIENLSGFRVSEDVTDKYKHYLGHLWFSHRIRTT